MTQVMKNKILRNLYLQKSFGFRYIEPFVLKSSHTQQDHFMTKETLQDCHLCDGSKSAKNKIFGVGDPNSKVIFITTTPSMDQNSLEIFTKMINNVLGLSLDEIYLTSLIKCDLSEKIPNIESYYQTCKGYILNQLIDDKKKLIVTLGDTYNYLLETKNDLSITRGTITKWNNFDLIPIYHPSYLLRNPSLKKETFDDLKKIKLLLEQL